VDEQLEGDPIAGRLHRARDGSVGAVTRARLRFRWLAATLAASFAAASCGGDGASKGSSPADRAERAALEEAAARERDGDLDAALARLEAFLAEPEPASARPAVHARARRFALLLARRGPEAAANALADELPRFRDDRDWVGAVAAVLVDALGRGAQDPAVVATLLPTVERLLEKAAADPELAGADELDCLALLRAGQARYVESVKLAELAVRRAPERARPLVVLARLYASRGEWEAALRELARAKKADPADPAAKLLHGRILCANADFAEAGAKEMLAALAADPALAGAREEIDEGLLSATQVLLAHDRVGVAQSILDPAVAAVGRRPALLFSLGRVAAKRRAFEDAVALFEETKAASAGGAGPEGLAREWTEALRDAGYARLLAGRRDEAIARFERALEVAPADVDVTAMRAIVQERRIAEARSAYDEASRLFASGDAEGAAKALARSIERLPANPLAWLDLGRIQLSLGRAKESEASLRRAIALGGELSIDVEDASPLLVRALADQEAGFDPVRAAIDDYLALHPKGRHADALRRLRDAGSR
jgi:tetratricopeptide (TPR) repeat protein